VVHRLGFLFCFLIFLVAFISDICICELISHSRCSVVLGRERPSYKTAQALKPELLVVSSVNSEMLANYHVRGRGLSVAVVSSGVLFIGCVLNAVWGSRPCHCSRTCSVRDTHSGPDVWLSAEGGDGYVSVRQRFQCRANTGAGEWTCALPLSYIPSLLIL
jgi:Na+-transporting methylmalonyl-CoA/oxaloacetate decarboxylase gamma subunit